MGKYLYKSNTLCIFIAQKKVLRIVMGANRYDHTNDIFFNLRILKFYDLVKLRTSVIMYQARNNTLPLSIQHIFTRYEGKLVNTRQKIDFVDKFARTNVREMSSYKKNAVKNVASTVLTNYAKFRLLQTSCRDQISLFASKILGVRTT